MLDKALKGSPWYWTLIALAVVVGLPLVHYAGVSAGASDWDAIDAFFISSQYNYWGSIPVALGPSPSCQYQLSSPARREPIRYTSPSGLTHSEPLMRRSLSGMR